jgi:hypothetical protein
MYNKKELQMQLLESLLILLSFNISKSILA